MKKESIAKEIVFLFIGFLLLIALIVCVYVISLDREYVQTTASVTEVLENEDKVIYTYIVKGEEYECKAKRNGSELGDRVRLYYHSDNVKKAKLNKTSKLIFVCPLIGLVLCGIGVIESIKKRKKEENIEEEQYKTKVISVLGETQKLKIITDGDSSSDYAKSLEETIEVPVKSILKKRNEIEVLDEDKVIFERSFKKNKRKIVKEDRKVIPNYYYISNGALVYEEFGKDTNEINFNDITRVVKTLNNDGNVVKLVVYANGKQYVLTNMGKCDIEVTANLLHNKMIAINEGFEFVEEHKEC